MRLGGALVCVCALISGALAAVGEKKKQILTLHALCSALDLMQGELSFRGSSMEELLAFLLPRTSGLVSSFVQELSDGLSNLGEYDFSELWSMAADSCFALSLRERELDELKNLGAYLGRYDLETQVTQLRGCRSFLQETLAEAEKRFPVERKLVLGLSVFVGLILTVLVI